MTERIVLLPGDGIGPEIMAAARELLAAVGEFETDEQLVGGASIDAHGSPLTDEVLAPAAAPTPCCSPPSAARSGTPPTRTRRGPSRACSASARSSGLFANIRPVRPSPALLDASPLKRERIEGTDLIVVRELTGGIYFGDRGLDGDTAHDTCVYSVGEIERIAARRRSGWRGARSRASTRRTSSRPRASGGRPWSGSRRARTLPLEHMLVDNAAMQLVSRPTEFDVILTENMFGDILSDEAAMLTGSLGMLPSASVGEPARACTSPCTAPRPISRAPVRQIRSQCSARWR